MVLHQDRCVHEFNQSPDVVKGNVIAMYVPIEVYKDKLKVVTAVSFFFFFFIFRAFCVQEARNDVVEGQ